MCSGIMEVDVHGKTCEQAATAIYALLKKCDTGTYRVRVIHGYHGGCGIKNMIQDEFGFGRCEQIKRIAPGDNPGITELILREF